MNNFNNIHKNTNFLRIGLPFVFIMILAATILSSCKTQHRISYQNIATNYNRYKDILHPEYVLFNLNADTSNLYCKINLNELLRIKPAGLHSYYINFSLKAEVFTSYESNTVIDSLFFKYSDSIQGRDYFTASFNLKVSSTGNFPVRITLTDLNKGFSSVRILLLNKTIGSSPQDFLVTDEHNYPVFSNYLHRKQRVKVVCRDKSIDSIIVKVFKRDFPVAPLPFVSHKDKPFDYSADSTFVVSFSNGLSEVFELTDESIYHFQPRTDMLTGLTLFRFHDDFPRITLPEQMLYPLRYLTTKNEYNKMIILKDKKMAVDDFWINTAGNTLRAKELIKRYYNRVQDANVFFTSYMEGWKTDRGLIYIIYGNPNIVYRNSDVETWIYGEEFNSMSVSFIFYKRENPFTDNDFILNRSPVFKDTWYNAVDVWRR